MIKAVLDTNVIVSSLINPSGPPGAIRRALEQGDFQLCLSDKLLGELEDVLGRSHIKPLLRVPPEEIEMFIHTIRQASLFVTLPNAIPKIVLDDPDDDLVLATAKACGADVIVSGDKHLLRIGRHEQTAIVTAATFISDFLPGVLP